MTIRISDLCNDFATRFALEKPRVSGVARALLEAGLLTKGARGVNAPKATPLDAARLLIALMVDGKTIHAVRDVIRIGNLPLCDEANQKQKKIFEDELASIIEFYSTKFDGPIYQADVGNTAHSIELERHLPSISITYGYGETLEVSRAGYVDSEMKEENLYPLGFRHKSSITNRELLSIGMVLSGMLPVGGEWTNLS